MKKGLPAHLRRACDLLGWLSAEGVDAKATWRGRPLGSWNQIRPRWKLVRGRLRFRFLALDHDAECWIVTVRVNSDGAEILLSLPGQTAQEPLVLEWRDHHEKSREKPPVAAMVGPALRWLRTVFPGCNVVSQSRRPDRRHTISGFCQRILIRWTGQFALVMVAPPEGDLAEMASVLTHALLWVAYLQRDLGNHGLPVHILVPAGSASAICHRASFIDEGKAKITVWEYEGFSAAEWRVRRASGPEPPREDVDFRWPVLGPFRWSSLLQRVLELAPYGIRRYPRFTDFDTLRLHGLEFARVLGVRRDRLEFGVGATRTELTDDNFGEFQSLVEEILYYRRPDSPDTHHPYFRMQAERWLECLILDEIPRLFPELLPESVYPQIPVYLGSHAGRIDILGADQQGRLYVLELKVAEDPDLPLQALDYWGRVIVHNQRGDFERRGYFSGITLDRRPPRIYLVSPVFSFHDTTEKLLSYLSPVIEVWKVSVNEDWRSGVKILRRVKLRCGDLK